MDIVSRIKNFIEVSSITNSQFADTCLIPRPTLSQLLNGRNKKVSDEIIGKIHVAYPNLSISWLLFGEGEMFIDPSVNNSQTDGDSENSIFSDNTLDLFENENLRDLSVLSQNDSTGENNIHSVGVPEVLDGTKMEASGVSVSKGAKTANDRKVVNIIVFYSDNSFEYFKPAQK